MSGFANLQVLGATSEDTSEWYERGLLAPGVDYDAPHPYLRSTCDPLLPDGDVELPQGPGLGFDIDWDYIGDNTLGPAVALAGAGVAR
jgi:L-alanine-DL-glutamate epimerase-like enolase superfamily enzyme